MLKSQSDCLKEIRLNYTFSTVLSMENCLFRTAKEVFKQPISFFNIGTSDSDSETSLRHALNMNLRICPWNSVINE